jgi:hypothetical protein
MKKKYILILSLMIGICISNKTFSQSLSISGSVFLPQDSIGFTYSKPGFTSTDWIGIYKADQTPGPGSIAWSYIKSETGTIKLPAPNEAGKYKAYLFCCDGYDVVGTPVEFNIEIPSLTTGFPSYVQGDSIVFSYNSPNFSDKDWIGIYPEGTTPGEANPSIEWKYISKSNGSITFKTALNAGYYDAYLLCCDGYDSITSCNFQVIDSNTPFVKSKMEEYEAGATLEFSYNDPAFATGDWIGIYKDGEPATGASITWSYVPAKSGNVTFPGNLVAGAYFAVLFNSTSTEYARSEAFVVAEATIGSYIKTSASVYPEKTFILVNYKDENYSTKDWIGIYKKEDIPGGGHESLEWHYALKDSSTVTFSDLPIGDYIAYLCCCDGYTVKAKYNFKVVGSNTASIVSSAISYLASETLEFTYNSPTFSSTDWIGIYHAGEIPGGANVYSIWWRYLLEANGMMIFSPPDNLGENSTPTNLDPGEYWAGLFCCDAYGLLAQTTFVITDQNSGIRENNLSGNLTIFPNPTDGLVRISLKDMAKLKRICVYTISGQLVYQENPTHFVSQKSIDLKYLPKGVYFLEALTDQYKTSKKLINK